MLLKDRQHALYNVKQLSLLFLLLHEAYAHSIANGICPISAAKHTPKAKGASRTWNVTDDDIQTHGLQGIVQNCTAEGDVIYLSTKQIITPQTSIHIPWPLTIEGAMINDEETNEKSRPSLTCPETDGIFVIESGSVTLRNLTFRDCDLDETAGVEALIQTEECDSADLSEIRIESVDFIENRNLGGSVGLDIKQPSCHKLIMKSVRFENNSYANTSSLTAQNELEEIYWKNNAYVGAVLEDVGFFSFPRDSQTTALFLQAENNQGSLLNVQGGNLNIQNATFERNRGYSNGVIMGNEGTLSVAFVDFVSNECEKNGSAISLFQFEKTVLTSIDFVDNKAMEGGTVFLKDAKEVQIESCRFQSNSATNGGALDLLCSKLQFQKRLQIKDSVFRKNNAEIGGAISLETCNETTIGIRNTQFDANSAFQLGGALSIFESHFLTFTAFNVSFTFNSAYLDGATRFQDIAGSITFEQTIFEQNTCVDFMGGAVYVVSDYANDFILRNSIFSQNDANIAGGAMYLSASELRLLIVGSNFEENKAKGEGGAMYLDATKKFYIDSSVFRKNSAEQGGGAVVLWKTRSIAFMKRIIFESNKAKHGGAISIHGSDANLNSCTFQWNNATEDGGAVKAMDKIDSLKFFDVSFLNNFAKNGGGIYSTDDTDLEFDFCSFDGNQVQLYGGGLFSQLITSDKTAIRTSSFTNNDAAIGGGACFQFDTYDFSGWRDEKVVSIMETQFSNNTATMAGGGYFIERLEALETDVDLQPKEPFNPSQGPYSSNFDSAFMDQNAVRSGYGANVATTRTHFYCKLIYLNGAVTPIEERGVSSTLKWQSGLPLPVIEVVAMDYFYQGPALTKYVSSTTITTNDDNRYSGYARAMLRATDGLLPNDLVTDISSGKGNITVGTPLNHPGLYHLELWPGDERAIAITIEIEIRNCTINEEEILDGTFCERCNHESYNFEPQKKSCQSCPSACNCEEWGIAPITAYWIRDPCSKKGAQRCVLDVACCHDKREQDLKDFFNRTMPSCQLTRSQIDDFQNSQCREGYEGPLCGSCSEDYGYYDLKCSKCGRLLFVYIWLVGTTVWTFIVCATVIIGNLTETGTLDTVHEILMPVSSLQSNESMNSSDIDEKIDIAQRNMTETIKILINFAQISSMAVTVSTDWNEIFKETLYSLEYVSSKTMPSLECMFPKDASIPRSVSSTILSLLIPVCVLIVLIGYWFIRVPLNSKIFGRRSILTIVAVFYVSYIGWAEELSLAMKCVEIEDGVSVWARDSSVQCYTGPHAVLTFVLVVPMIFIVLIAFPLLSACYLFSKRNHNELDSIVLKEKFGFMYAAYKENCVFWDCFVLVRKTSLALIVVFGASMGPNVTAITAICVLIFSLYLQARLLPYKDEYKTLNSGEIFSLLVSIFIFISVLYLNDPSLNRSGEIIVSLLALCFVLAFVLYILFQAYRKTTIFCRWSLIRKGIYMAPSETGVKIILTWIRQR